jgi:multidrug efflux pump subunit AcrB
MDRNTKIALGCGGAGCLGLIVVVIAGVLLYSFLGRSFTSNSNRRTFNFNLNSNSNSNANRAANRNSSANTDSSDSEDDTTVASSMSDDDKHKLFHAAGVAQDTALFVRVLKKMGFMNASGTTTAAYEQFINDHFTWALRNTEFINSVNTPPKARAYIEEHLNQ